MPIGMNEEHLALHEAARRWAADRCPPEVPRALLEAPAEELPKIWPDLAAQGWLGLHVAEEHGGAGYGLGEAAVVLEELGRACVPGPVLPTLAASVLIQACGGDALREDLLPGLADGSRVGAVAAVPGEVTLTRGDGGFELSGTLRPVLGAHLADVLVVPADDGGHTVWLAVDAAGADVTELASMDPTRRVADVRFDAAPVPTDRELPSCTAALVQDVFGTLAGAELAGLAGWALDATVDYAKVREQFGRPIGQFQAVKHRCADMLVRTEQVRALAWEAARAADGSDDLATDEQFPVAASALTAFAPAAAWQCAKDAVQLHGGIGFTWEHDAHLYLKRTTAMTHLLGAPGRNRVRAAEVALSGKRRELHVDLPSEAEAYRDEVRSFVEELQDLDRSQWDARLADAGYLAPHYPRPWGRGAGALEQLVIDEELRGARVRRPHLQVAAWVLPTLIQYGTAEQQERWIPPTMRLEMRWCQLFSEPGAGSDLAALSTRAERVEGGWVLSGQKVWTSMAQEADWGICLARTDPDAPKHEGITYFLLDMSSDGIDIRPLRELTGDAWFNEVYLDDVFVPDDCVVGEVDDGWRVTKNTLSHERVAMSSGSSFGGGLERILGSLDRDGVDELTMAELGRLLCDGLSIGVMGFRATLRALAGSEAEAEASVRKLLGVEHDQRVSEFALSLLGPEAATREDEAGHWNHAFLFNRCLTIAGGTSEVQRNVIGERILGLPKDPEPSD